MDENIKIEDRGSILIPKISFPEAKEKPQEEEMPKKRKFTIFKLPKGKWGKLILFSSLVLLTFFMIVGFLSFLVYKDAIKLKENLFLLKIAANEQDLESIEKELNNSENKLKKLEKSYKRLSFLKIIPYIGEFVKDGEHFILAGEHGFEAAKILLDTAKPYADILGLKKEGQEKKSELETTQDRIDFVVKTIPDLVSRTDELNEKISLVKKEVDSVNAEKYPESLFDMKIKVNIKKGKESLDLGAEMISNAKPLLEVAPYLLGVDSEREYLVLFQNDKELRPTGGFITAYSLAKVRNGRFDPVFSDDIYNLDNSYKAKIDAPDVLVKYLKGPYLISKKLRLRDMNWSPDFSESMKLFTDEAKSAGIKDIDGVIAVDTQVLVYLLEAIGPISVPEFGEFSTKEVEECKCPQVIYELESFADVEGPIVWSENEPGKIVFAPKNYENRKKIIGPLMNSLLSNALGQPIEKMPALFEAGFKSLLEKHVLLYLFDDSPQKAVETFGIAGILKDYQGDYLFINDANLGGRKSNLYVTQEVVQDIEIGGDGSVVKRLSITYKNPAKHDGWLNSVLPNYLRIYVPKGSELLEFSGVEEKAEPYEEFGRTVFAGYFQLRPEGIMKVNLKYKLPFRVSENYNLFIQKQPGTDAPSYSLTVGKKQDDFFLKTDKEINLEI